MEKTKLSSSYTVEKYKKIRDEGLKESIADLIYERFYERYIEPFKCSTTKHGFGIMASSCLMIETLFCFQNGRKRTGEAGGEVFEKFFSGSTKLKCFSGYGQIFYKNIRCGILHQGETYGGWKIRRTGSLLNISDKVINATKFINAIDDELKIFVELLKTSNFYRKPWRGVIRKLDNICENCI